MVERDAQVQGGARLKIALKERELMATRSERWRPTCSRFARVSRLSSRLTQVFYQSVLGQQINLVGD